MLKQKRNEMVHNIIQYLPNQKIKLSNQELTGEIKVIFTQKNCCITIKKDNTWDEVKRNIDNIFKILEKTFECTICFIESNRITSCNKCSSSWCIKCYINIFRANQGIIKCPFCRYEIGNKWPKEMIETGVQEILSKIP